MRTTTPTTTHTILKIHIKLIKTPILQLVSRYYDVTTYTQRTIPLNAAFHQAPPRDTRQLSVPVPFDSHHIHDTTSQRTTAYASSHSTHPQHRSWTRWRTCSLPSRSVPNRHPITVPAQLHLHSSPSYCSRCWANCFRTCRR